MDNQMGDHLGTYMLCETGLKCSGKSKLISNYYSLFIYLFIITTLFRKVVPDTLQKLYLSFKIKKKLLRPMKWLFSSVSSSDEANAGSFSDFPLLLPDLEPFPCDCLSENRDSMK